MKRILSLALADFLCLALNVPAAFAGPSRRKT